MFSKDSASSATRVFGNNDTKTSSRKQGNAAKFYVFTKFNCDSSIETEFQESLKLICQEFQYSHEICPETGKPHLQGQIILHTKMRKSQIVKFKHLNMYLANQKGNQSSNDLYICKNTDNLVKWTSNKNHLDETVKNELQNLSINDLINIRINLINKRFCCPDARSAEIALYDLIAESYVKFSPEPLNHHLWFVNDCLWHMKEIKAKQRSISFIDKYLK